MSGGRGAQRKKGAVIALLAAAVAVLAFACLLVGSSGMSVGDCLEVLWGRSGNAGHIRIIWNIRLPRVLAAVIAGAGRLKFLNHHEMPPYGWPGGQGQRPFVQKTKRRFVLL